MPDDFGLAESNYEHGHYDMIVPRPESATRSRASLALLAGGTPYRRQTLIPTSAPSARLAAYGGAAAGSAT